MIGKKTAVLGLWICLTCVVGFGMFIIKNKVQYLEKELSRINSNIANDIKTIHVLKAEWSHLNSPARLKQLAEKHIDLSPVQAKQIVQYASLPFETEEVGYDRRMIAQKNIGNYAKQNKSLKVLASMD